MTPTRTRVTDRPGDKANEAEPLLYGAIGGLSVKCMLVFSDAGYRALEIGRL